MKKLFFAVAFACTALFTACSEEEDTNSATPEPYQISFVGELTVSDAEGNVGYTQEDTVFDFESVDGAGKLVMNEMKFSQYMPVTLTITASGIPFISDNTFGSDSLVPTVADVPMPDYTLTNLSVEVSGSSLVVEFECYGSYAKFVSE